MVTTEQGCGAALRRLGASGTVPSRSGSLGSAPLHPLAWERKAKAGLSLRNHQPGAAICPMKSHGAGEPFLPQNG